MQLRLSVITAFASQRTDSQICCSVMDSRELCVYREHKGCVRVTFGYQVYSIPSLFNAQRYMYIGSSQLLYNSMCYFEVDPQKCWDNFYAVSQFSYVHLKNR